MGGALTALCDAAEQFAAASRLAAKVTQTSDGGASVRTARAAHVKGGTNILSLLWVDSVHVLALAVALPSEESAALADTAKAEARLQPVLEELREALLPLAEY